jgi:uncharacterized protein (DUF3820 family)
MRQGNAEMPRDDWSKYNDRDLGRRARASGNFELADSNVAPNGDELKFWFGKYKGKSVAEVMAIDREYLIWLAAQPAKRDPRLKLLLDLLQEPSTWGE